MFRTLRSAFLGFELAAFLAASFLSGGVLLSLRAQLAERYARRLAADIASVELVASGYLSRHGESLESFAALGDGALVHLPEYVELYELDAALVARRVLRRRTGSSIFAGYDFSRGSVGRFLAEAFAARRGGTGPAPGTAPRLAFSSVLRAPEDERPSLYVALRRPGGFLVGRLVIDSLMAELARVAQFAGTELAIADRDGIVLVASTHDAPSVLPEADSGELLLSGEPYRYASGSSSALGGRVAVMEAESALDELLAPVLSGYFFLLLALGLIMGAELLFVTRGVVDPIAGFAARVAHWEPDREEAASVSSRPRFLELDSLYRAFAEKTAEVGAALARIKERDEAIRALNEGLEAKVVERTAALGRSNAELAAANEELEQTLGHLAETQDRLVLSEKMAVLGRLAADVAHDLNTPLAAIRSSAGVLAEALPEELESLAEELAALDEEGRGLLRETLRAALAGERLLAGGEARALRSAFAEAIIEARAAADRRAGGAEERAGCPEPLPEAEIRAFAESAGDDLVDMGVERLEPGLARAIALHPRSAEALRAAGVLAGALRAGRIAQAAAERAGLIVDSLRSWSFEGGPALRPLSVAAELETILALYYGKLRDRVDIVRDFSEPGLVFGSAQRLNQVWVNLIDNAVYAMGGEGRIVLGIARVTAGGRPWIEVSVTDEGPGIPPEFRDSVFSPFFTTKPRGSGTGLGLDLCRRIVELHGGSIYFDSEPGRTRFAVRLPPDEVRLPPDEVRLPPDEVRLPPDEVRLRADEGAEAPPAG